MGKELNSLQWAALVLLMVGCGTSQLDPTATSIFAAKTQGIIICVFLSFTSASAGIATECILTVLCDDNRIRYNEENQFENRHFTCTKHAPVLLWNSLQLAWLLV
jgi:hypothetical protein